MKYQDWVLEEKVDDCFKRNFVISTRNSYKIKM